MSTGQHRPRLRLFLLRPLALLLVGIAFSAISAGAAGGDENRDDDDVEIDIMAFDLP